MTRPAFMLPGILLASMLAGCGGGGGSHTITPPPDIPTLTAIAPSTTTAGAAAITLSVYGSNFSQYSVAVLWNGTPLPTNVVSTTVLTATIPAASLASVGTAQISVMNGAPAGGTTTSNGQTFSIVAPPAATTWARAVAGIAVPQYIVWDSAHGKLYVSVAPTDPLNPNSIVPINPVTGVAGTPIAAGNNPNRLSISSDSSYLWAGLDGDNSVQRYLLPSLTTDISFPVPLDWVGRPLQAVSLQAAPVSPHTVGLVAGHTPTGGGNGVYVYDDAVQRPVFAPGFPPGPGAVEVDWLQWGGTDSTIYGNGFGGGIDILAVTSSGVSVTNFDHGAAGAGLTQYANGLMYSLNAVFNPINSSQTGSFDLPSIPGTVCTADSSLGRYYCVISYSLGSDVQLFELWVYDLNTYALIDRAYFGVSQGATISTITGQPTWLVRWGNAGLAMTSIPDLLRGPGGVFLIDGAAVNPNASPDAPSGTSAPAYPAMTSLVPQSANAGSGQVTVTINGTNFEADSIVCWFCGYGQAQYLPTTYVSTQTLKFTIPATLLANPGEEIISVFNTGSSLFSSNALVFTVAPTSGNLAQVTAFNLSGLAMAWDANNALLYIGVADWDSVYPNTIVAMDPETGAVVQAQNVMPDPDILRMSANGQYLYAAFAGITSMTQFQLPGLTSPVTWPVSNPQAQWAYYAGDMKAAPVSPHTTAVTLFTASSPESTGGVVVYDDDVMRPTFAPGWAGGQTVNAFYDTIAWGSTDQVLTSAPTAIDFGGPLYELQVTASGVTFNAEGTATFNTAGEIHSDFGTGLIYSDDGNVADPSTQAVVGSYGASGLVVPDSSLNKVFILGQTSGQVESNSYLIQSFDEKAYTQISGIQLDNLLGTPIAMARWGTSGLAVLTMNPGEPAGMFYLIQDSNFVTNAPINKSRASGPQELVKMRWKRISTADIVKMVQARRVGTQSERN